MRQGRGARRALMIVAVIAILAGLAIAILKVLEVTGWVLVVLGIVAATASAFPKLWEPIAGWFAFRHEDDDRLEVVAGGRPVPIAETNPYEIGVFESDLAVEASATLDGAPPYVPRDVD